MDEYSVASTTNTRISTNSFQTATGSRMDESMLSGGQSSIIYSEYASRASLLAGSRADDIKEEFAEQMNALQSDVDLKFHMAKKDRFLLESFIQHDYLGTGEMNAQTVVTVISTWLKDDRLNEEKIWSLLCYLGIENSENITFIKVAKIAAILSTFINSSITSSEIQQMGTTSSAMNKTSYKGKKFREMQHSKSVPTFNQMGERVISKIELLPETADGKVKGCREALRKEWKKQGSRVDTKGPDELRYLVNTLLDKVPRAFKRLVQRKKSEPFPAHWMPDQEYWIHPQKVTILNI